MIQKRVAGGDSPRVCPKTGKVLGRESSRTEPHVPKSSWLWFFYLVSGFDGTSEGTLGEDRWGTERGNTQPCP